MADHKSSLTDWIPVRMNLPEDPKVYAIASFLFRNKTFSESLLIGECDSVTVTDDVVTAVVVCALVRVWAKAQEFGTTRGDDRVLRHTSRQTIDSWARVEGICEAMEAVGWVVFDPDETTITLVRFRSYNKPKDDRARDAAAERQRIKRERDKLRDKDRDRGVTERDKSVTVTHTVEESREDKSTEENTCLPASNGNTQLRSSGHESEKDNGTSDKAGRQAKTVAEWCKANRIDGPYAKHALGVAGLTVESLSEHFAKIKPRSVGNVAACAVWRACDELGHPPPKTLGNPFALVLQTIRARRNS